MYEPALGNTQKLFEQTEIYGNQCLFFFNLKSIKNNQIRPKKNHMINHPGHSSLIRPQNNGNSLNRLRPCKHSCFCINRSLKGHLLPGNVGGCWRWR